MNEALQKKLTLDPGIKQFMQNYEHAVADDEVRKQYNSYIQGIFYVNGILRSAFEDGTEAGMKKGLQKGKQQGLLEGEQKAKLETARTFLKMGVSAEDVALGTNLPIETVRAIKV
jgi:predicted transposase/invertase (TIGR01784 family)